MKKLVILDGNMVWLVVMVVIDLISLHEVKAPFKSHQWIKNVKYMFYCLQNERKELIVSTILSVRGVE